MEDGIKAPAINKQPDPIQQLTDGQCPFILTTDDLMLELTKLHINNVNKEKLLKAYAGKLKIAEDFVVNASRVKTPTPIPIQTFKPGVDLESVNTVRNVECEKELIATKNELVKVKESNRLFDKNNKALDAALVVVRKELQALKEMISKVNCTS